MSVEASRPLSFGGRVAAGFSPHRPAKTPSIWSDPPERGRKVLELGFCSIILLWLLMVDVVRRDAFATDFHYAFWPAARHVLEGTSPYSSIVDFGRLPFVYPAPAAVFLSPFGLLPGPIADALFTLLLAAAAVLALRLCRVRDWRCYGIALLWAPVFSAVQAANITLLLALGLAVLWRLRDRTLAAAAIAALLVAVKIFLWPIIVWLAIRRGLRSGAWSVLLTVFITISSWSVIGFAGFNDYPHLVRLVERLEAPKSYSLVALGLKLGLGHAAATSLALTAGAVVLAAAALVARREDDGRRSFALTIAATILFSPVVWLHYFALLVVPVAILRPRFGPVWLLPLLLWPCPVMISGPTWWPLAPLLVFGTVIAVAVGWGRTVDLPARVPAAASL
jgi:glycosyl transferase family 87